MSVDYTVFGVVIMLIIRAMANATEAQSYIDEAREVIEDLKESGYQASFGAMANAAEPDGPSGAYTEVGKSYVLPLDYQSNFSSDVNPSDEFYMVTNETDLKQCSRMQKSGTDLYQIMEVKETNFDNQTVIFYEIQVRR